MLPNCALQLSIKLIFTIIYGAWWIVDNISAARSNDGHSYCDYYYLFYFFLQKAGWFGRCEAGAMEGGVLREACLIDELKIAHCQMKQEARFCACEFSLDLFADLLMTCLAQASPFFCEYQVERIWFASDWHVPREFSPHSHTIFVLYTWLARLLFI